MRLLHTQTLEIHNFFDVRDAPPYAILSHRWGPPEQEVSYNDFVSGRKKDTTGYRKIHRFCETAVSRGYEYGWIDTCCINKPDSSELAEALNSMYQWYSKSAICLVYLDDVRHTLEDPNGWIASKWFTRGWTLQEILAPSEAVFYDASWDNIGDKTSLHMQRYITWRTKIPEEYLLHPENIHRSSAAMRLSWLAGRITSRPEDMAYCMLGILNVTLPLLYGLGDKAFLRLQEEFIRNHDDESIYAWTDPTTATGMSGMLAPTANCFGFGGTVVVAEGSDEFRPPFSLTGKGLELRVPDEVPRWESEIRSPLALKHHDGCSHVRIILRCRRDTDHALIAIRLQCQSPMTWCRVACDSLTFVHKDQQAYGAMVAAVQMVYVERVYYVPSLQSPVAVVGMANVRSNAFDGIAKSESGMEWHSGFAVPKRVAGPPPQAEYGTYRSNHWASK